MARRTAERVILPGLVLAFVALWAVNSLALRQSSDLDLFFWPSAEIAAHGHPLLIYSANAHGQGPNANGPLGLAPLIPLVILANGMGWANDIALRAGVTDAVFALFAVVLAATATRIIGQARGVIEWPLATYCVILLAPALWISVGDYGHIEQPIELCLVVVAVGLVTTRRAVLPGVALGLAVLTRSTALLYLIPFALLPLATRRIKPTATVLSAAALATVAGFAPFFLVDGPNAFHSLIAYRGSVAIGGGSFWVAAFGTAWSGVAQHASTYLVLVSAVAFSATVLWLRPGVATSSAGFFGLLTTVAVCLPMLSDTAYPYYLLEPYVFAAIWWLARPGSALNWRVAVPLLLTGDVFLAKQAVTLPFTGPGLAEGIASSILLVGVVGLVMADLLLGGYRPRPLVSGRAPAPGPVGQPAG